MSSKHIDLIDFLVAALVQHDRELTALSSSLQQSIRLLSSERLGPVSEKVDELLRQFRVLKSEVQRLETNSLKLKASTRLSHSLAKTFQALSEEEGMTIHDVASLTGRSRTMETLYLNRLVEVGLARKTKKGRKYYFTKTAVDGLSRPVGQVEGLKSVMILSLVSERGLEDPKKARVLVSRRLKSLKDWRLERSTILSR